jgi:phage gp29-like protein
MNTQDSIIDAARIEQAIRLRYSPFPTLTMELLNMQLNQFRVGELRPAARTWEIMMERDGDLSVPAEKLFSDVSRLPWEIEKDEDSAEADAHAGALHYFYNNLTARSVLDGDESGGINLLLRQLMTAHAYRYSIHEIVLQISSASKKEITATFNHCPVWFFEARKGRLGFLKREFDIYGEPLQPGEWLPAVGRGMMRQCSIAYLTKWEPMSYWLLFCYRFGVPGIHGETDAPKDSPEWKNFVDALAVFANDWVTATNRNAKINLVEATKGGQGTLPFNELIERADRLFARAFRGGDLSTQSRSGGDVAGSNPQESEKEVVLDDAAQWCSDVLNVRVDEPIISYLFNTTPKAWLKIRVPKKPETDREINTLNAAGTLGIPVSIKVARERLQLPEPQEGEPLIQVAPAIASMDSTRLDRTALGNASEMQNRVAAAAAEILKPILTAYDERLQRILTITDPVLRAARWNELQAELKTLEQDHLADPTALVRLFEQINTRAFVAGLERKQPTT